MPGAKRDSYKVLGVSQVSTTEEIQRAYRAASKKYHPDLNPDLKLFSEDKMRELVEAYEILSDSDKRKEYDRQPCFQLRKSRRSVSQLSSKIFKKVQFKREESLLERVFSPFFKKKDGEVGITRNPQDADMHFTLGLSYAENENFYDQAIQEFRLAVKFDSTYPEALWNLGVICYRKGLFDEAVVNFQKVLSINRDDTYAKKMVELLRDDF